MGCTGRARPVVLSLCGQQSKGKETTGAGVVLLTGAAPLAGRLVTFSLPSGGRNMPQILEAYGQCKKVGNGTGRRGTTGKGKRKNGKPGKWAVCSDGAVMSGAAGSLLSGQEGGCGAMEGASQAPNGSYPLPLLSRWARFT